MTETVDVAIVGAGPYGLSLAAYLAHRGVEHRVFGDVMQFWRDCMPRGMFLKSEGFASNIGDPVGGRTLGRYCGQEGREYADQGVPVSLESLVGYGTWFAEALGLSSGGPLVGRVFRAAPGFGLELDDGSELWARTVVMAVGLGHFAHVPAPLAALGPRVVSHSSVVTEACRFAGRDVTVVGGGASALETAALLHEAGATTRVLVRGREVRWAGPPDLSPRSRLERAHRPQAALCVGWPCWMYSNAAGAFRRLPEPRRKRLVDTTFGPAGGWWLRPRVEGVLPLLLEHRVFDAASPNGRVTLSVEGPTGETTIETEHVVAATGYHPRVADLPMLDPALRAAVDHLDGMPRLSRSFESSVPGLHFVGALAAYSFGPVMRFVHGSEFASRRITAKVSSRRRR